MNVHIGRMKPVWQKLHSRLVAARLAERPCDPERQRGRWFQTKKVHPFDYDSSRTLEPGTTSVGTGQGVWDRQESPLHIPLLTPRGTITNGLETHHWITMIQLKPLGLQLKSGARWRHSSGFSCTMSWRSARILYRERFPVGGQFIDSLYSSSPLSGGLWNPGTWNHDLLCVKGRETPWHAEWPRLC